MSRLAASVIVTGLLRLAEQQGGFGAVLQKGDPTAGTILIVLLERGERKALLERLLQPGGNYGWRESGAAQNEEDMVKFLDRRRRFDPDLWIIELDTASAERFAAEMSELD